MIKTQFQQWLFEQNQPDEWWVAIDGSLSDNPVTLDEVEGMASRSNGARVQILHSSRVENGVWVDFELPKNPTTTPEVVSTPEPAAKSASISKPVSQAKRQSKPEQSTGGLICFLIGLGFSVLMFPIGLLIGVPLMLGIFVTKGKYICTACGNLLESSSTTCPGCRAEITGTRPRATSVFIWIGIAVLILAYWNGYL